MTNKILLVLIALLMAACGEAEHTFTFAEPIDAIEIIDPCGPGAVGPDEILFRMVTGEITAWYLDLGLVVLEPGIYVTTDFQQCEFEVTADGQVIEI